MEKGEVAHKRVMQKKEAKTAPMSPMRSSKKGMTCSRLNDQRTQSGEKEKRIEGERTSAMMNEKETTPTQREIQVAQ